MGEGVKALNANAFYNCNALANIQLSPTLQTIGLQSFMHCSSLTEIEIPASVETIGESAFSSASNLKSVKLNEGLKTIGCEAFKNTALEEITIPASAEEIGTWAFSSTAVKKITFLGKDISISVDSGIPKDCVICGYTGSTAQAYAESKKLTFEALDAEAPTEPAQDILLGDADQNGEVDILDVISINKAILGKEALSENGLKAVDFNGNEKPDSDEAMKVLKFIVGLIEDFNA